MARLDELLKQRAAIDAQIAAAQDAEFDIVKLDLAERLTMASKLEKSLKADILTEDLRKVFTDKSGVFNAYRYFKVKKP